MWHTGTALSVYQVEMPHDAYHEVVRIGMAFQVVHLGLLEVADVAYAHHCIPQGEIEGEQLAERRIVVQGGERHVPSSVA